MALSQIFTIVSAALSLYMIICFVRIMLSWFPGAQYSPVGRFLSSLCDPYLNLFRRFPLRLGAFDFSPALALCVLIALSSIFTNISRGAHITLGAVLAMLLSMAWSIVNSLLLFMIVLLLVRLVVIMIQGGYSAYGSLWDQFDRALSPIVFKIASPFSRRNGLPYKTALIISLLGLAAIMFAGRYAVGLLANILYSLPF